MTIQYPEDRLFHDVADDIRCSIDPAYLKQYGYRIHSVYVPLLLYELSLIKTAYFRSQITFFYSSSQTEHCEIFRNRSGNVLWICSAAKDLIIKSTICEWFTFLKEYGGFTVCWTYLLVDGVGKHRKRICSRRKKREGREDSVLVQNNHRHVRRLVF